MSLKTQRRALMQVSATDAPLGLEGGWRRGRVEVARRGLEPLPPPPSWLRRMRTTLTGWGRVHRREQTAARIVVEV